MKKLILLFNILLVGAFSYAQNNLTTTENYTYSKTYLSEDGTKSNETVQYFDGLGRVKQIIAVKASPSGKDMVVPVVYDDLGRQVKDILPVPMTTANAGIQTVSEASANTYYGVPNAYSEKKIEASPLGRPLEMAHPGGEWAMGSGHTQKLEYDVNVNTDQVKKYTVANIWQNATAIASIPTVSFYNEKVLFKNTVTDENGNKKIEFKNSRGQLVLARSLGTSDKQDTYYIYNDYDQLVYVLSPKADLEITANGNVVTQQILDNLCYQYRYDHKNRQVEKKIPGKGWEYFIYDLQNRLVASQDAAMRNNTENPNQWLFTRYDKFGRPVYTGKFTGGTRLQEQTNANEKGMNNESRSTSVFTANGQQVFYTNTAYPSAAFTLYTINYYDTYADNSVSQPATILSQSTLSSSVSMTVNGVKSIRSTKTLPTSSFVKNLDDDNWSSTHIWYDLKGRTIGTHGKNHLGGYTKTDKKLDFSGAVLFANTYHKKTNADAEVSVKERFVYDTRLLLKQHYHQVNNLSEELLADYTYNDLGQVTSKKVGNNLQNIEYTYNIRGLVTKVNDPANLGNKLFGYEMKFTSTSDPTVAPANYNGNITEMIWKNSSDGILKKYSYTYDAYNRLKEAKYQEPETTLPQNGFYNESVTYDSNGNILTLNRNQKSYAGLAEQIDQLVYSYQGNRLDYVVDNKYNYSGYPDSSGNIISYDANGSMISHEDKGILEMKYNILNLPSYIKFNNFVSRNGEDIYSNIQYSYRADGVKIKKRFLYFAGRISQDVVATTEYIDGFQYSVDSYSGVIPTLKFFATAEGYYDFENNKYIYSYVDHLGNIRVSYTREGANAVIIEKNDYYAFGLKHENTSDTSGVNYNYEYNGKEFQPEIGMNDYGARFYMPDLGRWGVIDPLAEMYRTYSPYNYAVNNPMRFIDPDGRSAMDTITKMGGTWQNVGFGYFNAELGKYVDYEGNILNPDQVLEIRSFLDPNGSGGSIGGGTSDSSLSPWMQIYVGSGFNFSQFNFTLFGAGSANAIGKPDCFFCKKISFKKYPLNTKVEYSKTTFSSWKEGKIDSGLINYLSGYALGKLTSKNTKIEQGAGVINSIVGSLKYESRFVYAEINVTSFTGDVQVNLWNGKIVDIQNAIYKIETLHVPIRLEERVILDLTKEVIYNNVIDYKEYPKEFNHPLIIGNNFNY